LETLGEHLRKRRLDLGLLQKEVAQRLGVHKDTICNWETNRTSPPLRYLPRIIQFLGHVPHYITPETFGERILAVRRLLGLSQRELARRLGVDPGTLGRWERGKGRPSKRLGERLVAFLSRHLVDGGGLQNDTRSCCSSPASSPELTPKSALCPLRSETGLIKAVTFGGGCNMLAGKGVGRSNRRGHVF